MTTNGADKDTSKAPYGARGFPESYFDVPAECFAGVVKDEGPDFKIEIEKVPVPEPAPDEVLLRLNVTGLCYSDVHFCIGDILPRISTFGVRSPGHEGAGVVVKVGSNVKNWKIGDRGGVKPLLDTCGNCELCWGDKEVYCRNSIHTGLRCTGTYQQYIVSPARYTTRIPDEVDDYTAAPIMCSASTMHHSLVESGLKPGNWAVFPGGGGGVGLQGVQLAKAFGFRPIVIDTGSERRDLCLSLGAEAFIDFKEVPDTGAEVVKIADGQGAHAVFVTAPKAYETAISLTGTRIGARVMCIGLPARGSVVLGEDPNHLIFRNLTLTGTLIGSMHDTDQALQFAKRGLLKGIWTAYPLQKMPEAVAKLKRGEVAGRCVVDFNL